MGVPQLHRVDAELQPLLRGDLKAAGNVQIVRPHAEKPRHQGPVGAVTLAGLRERAVKGDVRLHRLAAQQSPCHVSDADGSRRVGAGGTHHHRPQNVENIQHVSHFLSFRLSAWRRQFRYK